MSVEVTLAGNTYEIPQDEEVGWEDLTNYLVALAAAIQTPTSMNFSVRIAATTPQTLQATDAVLLMNVAAPSVVNLPAGIRGQFYMVGDLSGAAETNNITITPNGAQTIGGSATKVIRTNKGFVILQYNGVSDWTVVSEITDVFASTRRWLNSGTNASFIESSVVGVNSFATATNGQSCSASFTGSNAIKFIIALSTGQSIECSTSYGSENISAINDLSNLFLTSDAGTGIYISKSAASASLTFKNRTGGSVDVEIKALTNRITSITAWS